MLKNGLTKFGKFSPEENKHQKDESQTVAERRFKALTGKIYLGHNAELLDQAWQRLSLGDLDPAKLNSQQLNQLEETILTIQQEKVGKVLKEAEEDRRFNPY